MEEPAARAAEGVAEDLAGLADAGVEERGDGVPGDGEGDDAAEEVDESVAAADVGELMEEDGGELVVVLEVCREEENGAEEAGDGGGGVRVTEEEDFGDGDVETGGAGGEEGGVKGGVGDAGAYDEMTGSEPSQREAEEIDGKEKKPEGRDPGDEG